jgi:hypothetical protein
MTTQGQTPGEREAARLLGTGMADLAENTSLTPSAFKVLAEYRAVLRQLLSERTLGPREASWITNDGSAWLSPDDLMTVLAALGAATAVAITAGDSRQAVLYRAVLFRLRDDR